MYALEFRASASASSSSSSRKGSSSSTSTANKKRKMAPGSSSSSNSKKCDLCGTDLPSKVLGKWLVSGGPKPLCGSVACAKFAEQMKKKNMKIKEVGSKKEHALVSPREDDQTESAANKILKRGSANAKPPPVPKRAAAFPPPVPRRPVDNGKMKPLPMSALPQAKPKPETAPNRSLDREIVKAESPKHPPLRSAKVSKQEEKRALEIDLALFGSKIFSQGSKRLKQRRRKM